MKTHKGGVAVVFWGPHSVSSEMFAHRLHAACYLIHYLGWKRPWQAPFKYPLMWFKTWWVLLKQQPSAVFVINTPVFAPICVYFYCLIAGIPFAMNVHGHTLSGRKWGWSRPLQRLLAKRAVVNLVGTAEYKQIFESWGAPVLFLEDPPLELPSLGQENNPGNGEFRVTVVSTFAGDEPLDLVLQAARQLAEIEFFILGDPKLAKNGFLESAPRNVMFPGYLRGNDYWKLFLGSQAIMTLTTNPHSLVSGGTEAMYAGKPQILSRQPALVQYFTKGTVFVDHTAESIVQAVRQAREHLRTLTRESEELAAEKRALWESGFGELVRVLGGVGG